MKILEAVPNISEAQNPENLRRILAALPTGANAAKLLHVDPNPDANRTVLTLAGTPNEILRSCKALFSACQKYINMRLHHGAHPRLGAVDVCPFVPVAQITMKETCQLADSLAQFVGNELHIPVYLYEENATTPLRKNLAYIRRGEYESLAQKLKALPPDYGTQHFSPEVARSGASVIGARPFLIAFNISLATQELSLARQIATYLREKNGGLKAVKAIGWYMPHYHCAQVSFNLTNFHQTNLHHVFEACKQQATQLGTYVTGSELIGLIPQEAILKAGKFYAPLATAPNHLIEAAVHHLLLNKIRPFVANERILEYVLRSN